MSKTDLRKFLSTRSAQQLAEEVLILHERFPEVREYYAGRLKAANGAELFAKYARQIDQEFSTSARNPTGRPSKGREILRAYKRVAVSNEDTVALTLYYVSAVLTFMQTFGIQEDAYFRTVETAFREAAEDTAKHGLASHVAGAFEEALDLAMETSEDFAFELQDLANRYGVSEVEAD